MSARQEQIAKAWEAVTKHPGHPDQSVHGKKGARRGPLKGRRMDHDAAWDWASRNRRAVNRGGQEWNDAIDRGEVDGNKDWDRAEEYIYRHTEAPDEATSRAWRKKPRLVALGQGGNLARRKDLRHG